MGTGFVRGLLGDAETARDLYQEAARATWERVASGAVRFEDATHARNYLFQALRNLAIDARAGRRTATRELPSEPSDPAARPVLDQLVGEEQQQGRETAMRAAWQTLPAREREALHMRYLEGRTYKEMAVATGRSISTLQARVSAGLERLRKKIGNHGGPE